MKWQKLSSHNSVPITEFAPVIGLILLAIFYGIWKWFAPTPPDRFEAAKYYLETKVYYDHMRTLYCNAEYDVDMELLDAGNYLGMDEGNHRQKVEWEHAVPAAVFGKFFREWREGDEQCVNDGKQYYGRRCARKASKDFNRMEADMYNLFPAIGFVNARRGNKNYAELPNKDELNGLCGIKSDRNAFEPPDRAKGQVARASLYMADRYPIFKLSQKQKNLFEAWNRLYPADAWECQRAKRIKKIQGNPNPYIESQCK